MQGELQSHLDPAAIAYFHADFESANALPGLKGLISEVGGERVSKLQPQLIVGALLADKTQLVSRTESSATWTLAAIGSGRVQRLADRLFRIEIDHAEPISGTSAIEIPTSIDDRSILGIQFAPVSLYEISNLAPQGLNLNFIAKSLEAATEASIGLSPGPPVALRLTASTSTGGDAKLVSGSLEKSMRFVESVTRTADPENVWLPALQHAIIETKNRQVLLTMQLSDEILRDLTGRLSRPSPDR